MQQLNRLFRRLHRPVVFAMVGLILSWTITPASAATVDHIFRFNEVTGGFLDNTGGALYNLNGGLGGSGTASSTADVVFTFTGESTDPTAEPFGAGNGYVLNTFAGTMDITFVEDPGGAAIVRNFSRSFTTTSAVLNGPGSAISQPGVFISFSPDGTLGAAQSFITGTAGVAFDPANYDFGDTTGLMPGLAETFGGLFNFPSPASYSFSDTSVLEIASTVSNSFEAAPFLPELQTTPGDGGTLDFGHVLVGGTSPAELIAITNVGQDGLSGLVGAPANQSPAGPPDVFTRTTGGSYGPFINGQSTNAAYTFSPNTSGAFSADTTITNDDDSSNNSTVNLTGVGVQPIYNDSLSGDLIFQVRAGDTGSSGTLTVTNTGDGNLAGTPSGNTTGVAGVGDLNVIESGLPTGYSRNGFAGGDLSVPDPTSDMGDPNHNEVAISYTFNAAGFEAGDATGSITIGSTNGGTDNAPNLNVATFQAEVVGPSLVAEYTANNVGPNGDPLPADGIANPAATPTIDFGDIEVNTVGQVTVTLTNDALAGDLGSLTDLSILGTGGGGDPEFGIALGAGDGLIESDGSDLLELVLTFAPTTTGMFSATGQLTTDQNAPFGVAGDVFNLNLVGNAIASTVPEPASLALWGLLGLLCCGYAARRRRGKA